MNQFFKDFLTRTAHANLSPSGEEAGQPQPSLELPIPEDAALIALPLGDELVIPPADLRTVIEQRKTLRRYPDTPLSLAELSYLLWLTQGVRRVTDRPVTMRTVPSAGARHAFETYLLINPSQVGTSRVDGLEPGLYRFIATKHALLKLPAGPGVTAELKAAALGQESFAQAAAVFIWAAVTERMAWRYAERSARYLHLDAGHVCQNLYLAAESIGFGVCAIGAYEDAEVNRILGLDGVEQFVIYMGTVGKKP